MSDFAGFSVDPDLLLRTLLALADPDADQGVDRGAVASP